MTYYYVFIRLSKDKLKGRKRHYLEITFKETRVAEIANSYNAGKPFLFCGVPIKQSEIERIMIFKSEMFQTELLLPNKKTVKDERNASKILKFMENAEVEGIEPAMEEFDLIPSEERFSGEPKETVEAKQGVKNEVFIVHGRDEKQALLLQKHLREDLGIRALMFEDFKKKTGSATIIEQLQYIWKSAGYAFIIATPDDCGVLYEEFEKSSNTLLLGKGKVSAKEVSKFLEILNTRARQNVVFEFGLFMGVLGRDNVCCLLQESTKERPSDIDGVLYTPFNKSIDEKFGEIDAKMRGELGKKT
jgi:predicted nucleotide-binding protein